MAGYKEQFLFLLKTALNDKRLPDGYTFDVDRVFLLAQQQNLFPFIYEKAAEADVDNSVYKNKIMRLCGMQINKNLQFSSLYNEMKNNGLFPLVVKGPVCAALYTNKDYRLSSDFDIIFPSDDSAKYDAFFIEHGFVGVEGAYKSADGSLYIEISSHLGEGNDKYSENADIVFDGFFERAIMIDGYMTLSYDEHLVYLIYHAFKHFIRSGFGLRQLADIYMYIKKYRQSINFNHIIEMLDSIGIRSFADNCMFAISRIFDYSDDEINSAINHQFVCFDDFIDDLLDAGVFGKSSEDRLHSATIVHNTVASDGRKSVLGALFPSYKYMKNRYVVLKRWPVLLPLLWIVRIFTYMKKSVLSKKKTSPVRSINIAEERINLMQKMGIL